MFSTRVRLKRIKHRLFRRRQNRTKLNETNGGTNLSESRRITSPLFAQVFDVKVLFKNGGLAANWRFMLAIRLERDEHDQTGSESCSFSRYQDASVGKYIDENYHRLRPISEDGKCFGCSAFDHGLVVIPKLFEWLEAVGACNYKWHHSRTWRLLWIRRLQTKIAARSRRVRRFNDRNARWAEVNRDSETDHSHSEEQCILSAALRDLVSILPPSCASALIRGKIASFGSERTHFTFGQNGCVILKSSFMEHADVYNNILQFRTGRSFRPYHTGGDFYDLAMKFSVPRKNYSVMAGLHRALLAQGKSPQWS